MCTAEVSQIMCNYKADLVPQKGNFGSSEGSK
jgi:hypothetical protein